MLFVEQTADDSTVARRLARKVVADGHGLVFTGYMQTHSPPKNIGYD